MHALVQGEVGRAGATLGAISTGASPPPRLDVLNSPEVGTLVSTSVCLLATPGAAPPWGEGRRGRAPTLWPRRWPRRRWAPPATSPSASNSPATAPRRRSLDATLADLRRSHEWRLSALDALAMLGDGEAAGSPLAR